MAIGTTAAILGSAAIGAGTSILGSRKAAKAQTQAANKASGTELQMQRDAQAFNKQMYGKGREDVVSNFRTAATQLDAYDNPGRGATLRMAELAGLGGNPNSALNALRSDPAYQFRMQQGVSALDRSAAARGMLQSGAQQKALARFGQGLASEEYGNIFNRVGAVQGNAQQAAGALSNLYMNRGTTLGNLATGQASQNQNLAMNTSNALGNYAMAGGQARASGYEGMASGINSGLQNGLTAYMMQQQVRQPGMYGNNFGGGLRGITGMLGGGV
jgi:hypothetical protein